MARNNHSIKYYSSNILFLSSCTWVIKTLGPSLQRGKPKGTNLKVVTSQNRLVYIVRLIFIFTKSQRTKIQKETSTFYGVILKGPSDGKRLKLWLFQWAPLAGANSAFQGDRIIRLTSFGLFDDYCQELLVTDAQKLCLLHRRCSIEWTQVSSTRRPLSLSWYRWGPVNQLCSTSCWFCRPYRLSKATQAQGTVAVFTHRLWDFRK